jgi:hypothetical protein
MTSLARLRSNEGAFTRYVHAAVRPVVVAQLILIPLVLVPLVVDAGPTAARVMDAADTAFWLLFLADYLVRLYLVPTPRHSVATHLLDLALTTLIRPTHCSRHERPGSDAALPADGRVLLQLDGVP